MEQSIQGVQHDTGAKTGDLALYDDFRSKSQILGGNNSTPYILGIIDLAKSGPVVMDYPAGATAGALIDMWERPVTDVGLPGTDKGQGAKYLFLGPRPSSVADRSRAWRS